MSRNNNNFNNMNTLAGTTWVFQTQGTLTGSIAFQQVGPSLNAGVATITGANPPVGEQITTFQASWAESIDGTHFAVQFADFELTPGLVYPPPLGLPTIHSDGGVGQLVVLFGSHSDGKATMFGTNFQTACHPSGHVVGSFNMTKLP